MLPPMRVTCVRNVVLGKHDSNVAAIVGDMCTECDTREAWHKHMLLYLQQIRYLLLIVATPSPLYYIVLYYITMHCNTVYCVVLYYSPCIILYSTILQCLALPCSVLYCIILCYMSLWCIVFGLYCITCHHDTLYCIVLYCTVPTHPHSARYQVFVLVLTIMGTLLGCVYPWINCLVLMAFGIPAAVIMWKEVKRYALAYLHQLDCIVCPTV